MIKAINPQLFQVLQVLNSVEISNRIAGFKCVYFRKKACVISHVPAAMIGVGI